MFLEIDRHSTYLDNILLVNVYEMVYLPIFWVNEPSCGLNTHILGI